MKLLALSTATPRCSVAVVEDDRVLAQGGYDDEMRHAERLFGLVDEVLASAGVERGELEAIACDLGPGSFTGVRVGVASAKGMAFGLGLPLLGVCGLEAMAEAVRVAESTKCVVPVTDGKRGELFFAIYDPQGGEMAAPRSVPAADFQAALGEHNAPLVACGDILDTIDNLEVSRVKSDGAGLPDARYIARLALRRIAQGDHVSVTEVEPIYARAPDAIPRGAPGHGKRVVRPDTDSAS